MCAAVLKNAYLLIFVGEEKLEHVTIGNDWVPAHSCHPTLQPLHTHFNKLFLETPFKQHSQFNFTVNNVVLSVFYAYVYFA